MRLGYVYYFRGRRLEDARALLVRARALFVGARGPDYVLVGRVDRTLSEAAFEMGHAEEGLEAIRRSEAIESRWSPNGAWTGVAFVDEANELMQARAPRRGRGRPGPCRHHVLAARRRRMVPAPPRAAPSSEGGLRGCARRGSTFLRHLRRARGGDEVLEAWPLTGEGLDLLGLGRAGEAVPPLERAATLRRKAPSGAELGETLFALARALFSSHADASRARSLAREARDAYEPLGARYGVWFAAAVRGHRGLDLDGALNGSSSAIPPVLRFSRAPAAPPTARRPWRPSSACRTA